MEGLVKNTHIGSKNLTDIQNNTRRRWVTSDLHLGHTNIIKYCNRPFINITEMNRVLVDNWNSLISENDIVYFIGDLAFDWNNTTDYWLLQFNGDVKFIIGNHDRPETIRFYRRGVLRYPGLQLFLTHDPK